MKRLINITSYKTYIKRRYYADEDYNTNIDEDPQVSLDNLINTLRDIVNNTDSNSKEELYIFLIEHLRKIKSIWVAINKNDETLGQSGGNNKQYKEILGKRRRIYKIKGSRKEHIKYKGELIPVSDYKKLFKK
jgi:hypothetical protein